MENTLKYEESSLEEVAATASDEAVDPMKIKFANLNKLVGSYLFIYLFI
jgi:hypothetical protein